MSLESSKAFQPQHVENEEGNFLGDPADIFKRSGRCSHKLLTTKADTKDPGPDVARYSAEHRRDRTRLRRVREWEGNRTRLSASEIAETRYTGELHHSSKFQGIAVKVWKEEVLRLQENDAIEGHNHEGPNEVRRLWRYITTSTPRSKIVLLRIVTNRLSAYLDRNTPRIRTYGFHLQKST